MPEVKVVNNREDFKAEAELGNIVVWNGKDELFKVLEDLKLSDSVKYRLKACYETQYKDGLTFYQADKKLEKNRLSEILQEKLNFDKDDKLVVKSDDITEVLKTIQQLIYLDLILDVYTQEEVLKKSIVDKFYKSAKDIKNAVLNFQTKLKIYKTKTEAVLNRKNELEKLTNDILEKIEKSFEKTIKVAVFATKKTGKSMIVNGLLGEEYAPTSLELATPNVIEYIPHDEEKIILEYENSVKEFNSPREIKEYIGELFKEVNIKGKKLPVMKVKYPRKKGVNYEIYDTPGPDLAGSEHHEFIDEYIEKSDVIIFAIDYSKYAQESEVKLLEKIKSFFEQRGKDYSLVCVLNKIDLMFQDSNTEKNRIRATDFIHNKMKELGFKNFIVLPLSALIYFYTEKVLDVYKKYKGKDIDKDKFYDELNDFREELRKNEEFRKNFNDEEKTYMNNVFNVLNNLIDHFWIENPTYYDLIKWTGFSYLLEYINYVVENKATLEKAWSILDYIESKVTEIENNIATKKFLKKEIEELKTYLDDFLRQAQEEYAKEEIEREFENIKKEFKEFFIKVAPESIYNTIDENMRKIFNERKKKIKESLDNFIKNYSIPDKGRKFKEEEKDKIMSEFERKLGKNFIGEEEIKKLIEAIQKESKHSIENYLDEIKRKIGNLGQNLAERKERIKRNINELNEKVKKNYNFEVELKLPTLETDMNLILTELDRAIENVQGKLSDLIHKKLNARDILKFEERRFLFFFKRYKISASSIREGVDRALSDFEKDIEIIARDIRLELYKIFNSITLDLFNMSVDMTKEEYIAGLEAIINPVKRIYSELDLERTTKQEVYDFLDFVGIQFDEVNEYFNSFREAIERIRNKKQESGG